MNQKTYQHGCRSGIQKAIRRCDLGLAKTCFDALWADKESRAWLKWRTAVLVNEDVWFMLGAFSEFLGGKPVSEDEWWEFVRTLVVVNKQKDTEGLLYYTRGGMDFEAREHVEAKWMRRILATTKDPNKMADMVGYDIADNYELTDYEKKALRLLWHRSKGGGGMLGDRRAMVAGMILIATRGLPKAAIESHIAFCKRSFFKKKIKKLKQLPWYVFDMHTRPGLIGLSAWVKKWKSSIGIDYAQMSNIWFKLESAKLERWVAAELKDKPAWTENMWWPRLVDRNLRTGEYSGDQIRGMWVDPLRPTLKEAVGEAITPLVPKEQIQMKMF